MHVVGLCRLVFFNIYLLSSYHMTRRVVNGVGQWEAEANRHVFLGSLYSRWWEETISRDNNAQRS